MTIRSIRTQTGPNDLPVKRVARGPLSDQVVRAIEELVDQGILIEGKRLPTETALAAQFGVGRSTVREATRGLALMGVLDIRVGDGTYVRAGAKKTLSAARSFRDVPLFRNAADILQARRVVEIGALDLVVERATAEDIKEIEASLFDLKAARSNLRRFICCDLAFHSTIIRATKNEILVEMYSILRKYFQEATVEISQIPGVLDQLQLHEALVEMIKSRNVTKARKVMNSLLQGLEALVTTNHALKSGSVSNARSSKTPRGRGSIL